MSSDDYESSAELVSQQGFAQALGVERRVLELMTRNEAAMRHISELQDAIVTHERVNRSLSELGKRAMERAERAEKERDQALEELRVLRLARELDVVPAPHDRPGGYYLEPGDQAPPQPMPVPDGPGAVTSGRTLHRWYRLVPAHDITAYELARLIAEAFQPTLLDEQHAQLDHELARHFRLQD